MFFKFHVTDVTIMVADSKMEIKPTVAFRAAIAGGIAVFAKFAAVMKAAGGVKLGAAAAAMSAATAAAVSGSKKESQ